MFPSEKRRNADIVFYDGGCGFCRRSVRFAAKRERNGVLRFAPLYGKTFEGVLPREIRQQLPEEINTLLVWTRDDELLDRWVAVRHILRLMTFPWPLFGILGFLVPTGLGDWFYNIVARRRGRIHWSCGEDCLVSSRRVRARMLP